VLSGVRWAFLIGCLIWVMHITDVAVCGNFYLMTKDEKMVKKISPQLLAGIRPQLYQLGDKMIKQ
jgi:hypothetical protein